MNILLNLFLFAPSSLVVCVYGNATKERGMVCNADSGGPLIVEGWSFIDLNVGRQFVTLV